MSIIKTLRRWISGIWRSHYIRYPLKIGGYALALCVYPTETLAHAIVSISHLTPDYSSVAKVTIYYVVVAIHIRHDAECFRRACHEFWRHVKPRLIVCWAGARCLAQNTCRAARGVLKKIAPFGRG